MKHGEVRIISGSLRGRKLRFPAIPGLRPTPDSARETLFNWLATDIGSARCLDLFSGSGALGIEALSRGASFVTFIEQNFKIAAYLRGELSKLNITEKSLVYCRSAFSLPKSMDKNFNIVFIDPPFRKNLIKPCCKLLEDGNYLTENAYIYIEAESELDPLPIPTNWEILHSKKAGQVGYHLISRN